MLLALTENLAREVGMAWKRSVLVVANVTATSDELLRALKARAERQPASFTLVVPATPFGGGREAAEEMLACALEQLGAAGLEADGEIGNSDPIVAVTEAWDPKRFDEIIVSTLPMRFSKWLHAGLPERIGKLTGAPVTHVVSAPPKPAPVVASVADHDRRSAMGPLSVLAWGAHKD
jgi:GABA permease